MHECSIWRDVLTANHVGHGKFGFRGCGLNTSCNRWLLYSKSKANDLPLSHCVVFHAARNTIINVPEHWQFGQNNEKLLL